ncbi:protein FAR1-RELATED SEQUENCE 5-like isoform X2 [Ananas comosus]|uniref:Protein FAR1-RELATED SEQUENCE n=1 Tax=Ananas comosus TaxID=4615 RepID=A0A6P5FH07_ANACO|nr:protein FAR1-RELATED SEQUENCE 5-like isoform X2 [Ananas comosus]
MEEAPRKTKPEEESSPPKDGSPLAPEPKRQRISGEEEDGGGAGGGGGRAEEEEDMRWEAAAANAAKYIAEFKAFEQTMKTNNENLALLEANFRPDKDYKKFISALKKCNQDVLNCFGQLIEKSEMMLHVLIDGGPVYSSLPDDAECIDHMESKSTDVDDAITIGSTSFMLDADNTDRDNNYSDAEKDNDVSDMDTIFEHDYEYHDHQSSRVESLDNEPHVGMEFDSFEEARDFYNIYAFKAGFSIRKTSHYKAKKHDNMVTAHQYCCSKQGHSTRPSHENEKTTGSDVQGTPQKDNPNRRTGCKARMRVRMVEPQKWIIVTFEKDHNHELITTPTKTFFRSHKTITTEQKQLIYMLNEQNISTSQIMSFLAAKEGGRNYVPFTHKDVSSEVALKNRSFNGIDVSSALNYFREIRLNDPSFFYAVNVDEEHMARNLFWVDGRSRMAYQHFSDVVTFDTTYMTNKYNMPFAPFIGVNHHKQSIFFGCALIRDETASTFVWLFRTWLQAMEGHHPKAIITDQDPAMKKAIEEVFPNTVHRCCLWHIMRKAREHLALLYSTKEGFEEELKSCINYSLTIKEFETEWVSLIERYNLHDNNHLSLLWRGRHQWAPVFFRDTFFAGMSMSQSSEGMNALSKILLDSCTSVYKFVQQFEKLVASRHEKEDEQDFKTASGEASLWSYDPIEKQARDVYTHTLFKEVKRQLKYATGYRLVELQKNVSYKISNFMNPDLRKQSLCSYIVSVDLSEKKINCNCKMFEFVGILCSHILKVMSYIGIDAIPPHYILKRWTKYAKKVALSGRLDLITNNGLATSNTQRFESLNLRAQKVIIEGSRSAQAYQVACQKIDLLANELAAMNLTPLHVGRG